MKRLDRRITVNPAGRWAASRAFFFGSNSHKAYRMFLCLSFVASSSCTWPFPKQRQLDSSRQPHALNDALLRESPSLLMSPSPGRSDVEIIELAFDVVRADLPLSGPQHSRKIWNHADELRVGADVAVHLERNGLRMGVASTEAWPALQTILESANAVVRRDRLVPQRGLPLWIHLGSIADGGESIFVYGRDQRLVGKTIPAGEKLLTVDYAYHPELADRCELRLGLEVRHNRGSMTWERSGGMIKEVPDYDRHVLLAGGPSVMVGTDEFIVLSLGEKLDNPYLLGPRFLTDVRRDPRMETVLFLTPRPYSVTTNNRAGGTSMVARP